MTVEIIKSFSKIPSIFPNKTCIKCSSVSILVSKIRPTANMNVKMIPITVSSFSRQLFFTYPTRKAHEKPDTNAPTIRGKPSKAASTKPGKTAWDIASPIIDQPLRTRKQEKIEQEIAITKDINRARIIKSCAKGAYIKSIRLFIKQWFI